MKLRQSYRRTKLRITTHNFININYYYKAQQDSPRSHSSQELNTRWIPRGLVKLKVNTNEYLGGFASEVRGRSEGVREVAGVASVTSRELTTTDLLVRERQG